MLLSFSILTWILSAIIKKLFPQDGLEIKVDDFGYFCVKGVHVSFNKNLIVVGVELIQENDAFTCGAYDFPKPYRERIGSFQKRSAPPWRKWKMGPPSLWTSQDSRTSPLPGLQNPKLYPSPLGHRLF